VQQKITTQIISVFVMPCPSLKKVPCSRTLNFANHSREVVSADPWFDVWPTALSCSTASKISLLSYEPLPLHDSTDCRGRHALSVCDARLIDKRDRRHRHAGEYWCTSSYRASRRLLVVFFNGRPFEFFNAGVRPSLIPRSGYEPAATTAVSTMTALRA
jgi:hypothetical protein